MLRLGTFGLRFSLASDERACGALDGLAADSPETDDQTTIKKPCPEHKPCVDTCLIPSRECSEADRVHAQMPCVRTCEIRLRQGNGFSVNACETCLATCLCCRILHGGDNAVVPRRYAWQCYKRQVLSPTSSLPRYVIEHLSPTGYRNKAIRY